MDDRDDDCFRKWCELPRKTLQIVVLLSFFSFLYSYCSGSSSYNLHLSTFIFSLFAHAMDRSYVFLICNLILAFLLNNFTFFGSTNPAAAADAPPHPHTLNQMPATSLSPNAPECTCHPLHQHNLQEDDDDQEQDDLKEEEEDEADQGTSTVEEITDASVSTEELNQKFEEFIRKMKEEIRIEAQQQQPIPVSNHSFS